MHTCHIKKNVSKSSKLAKTSTKSCQQDGASCGSAGLPSVWKSAVAGSTAVRYRYSTLRKQSNQQRRDGGGPEPAAILHERTRGLTLPSASSARKGAQSNTWVKKAKDAGRNKNKRSNAIQL
ncbi:hypothetical protein EYF80_012148 [Liparis tanakae]|uniref:Uncharacterized protein n=1 Tax=Liparis tanakae TaxID=230148 RepID=A0A4Z2II76_9TELE|nr:hypothetical protein EYF80_012148 [Liparis tanakae]